MIFEMTRDYSIIVPLMISNLIRYFVSHRLQRQPIYDALAHQEGVFLPAGESREHLTRMLVSEVTGPCETVSEDIVIGALPPEVRDFGRRALLVTSDGRLVGLLSGSALRKATHGETAGQLAQRHYPYVHPDQPLSLALERMGDHQLDLLPVVSRADISKLLGVVTLTSILNAYGVNLALPDSTEAL